MPFTEAEARLWSNFGILPNERIPRCVPCCDLFNEGKTKSCSYFPSPSIMLAIESGPVSVRRTSCRCSCEAGCCRKKQNWKYVLGGAGVLGIFILNEEHLPIRVAKVRSELLSSSGQ